MFQLIRTAPVSLPDRSWNSQLIGRGWILWLTFSLLIVIGSEWIIQSTRADELILDERLKDHQTLGDFDICTVFAPAKPHMASMLDDHGEIKAGDLYRYFRQQGLTSVSELSIYLDFAPTLSHEDYALHSMELKIEGETDFASRTFHLGEHSLLVPQYERSSTKPEARVSVRLDYDFMQHFNENSTEKLKFNYLVNGYERAVPVRAWVDADTNEFSMWRIIFVIAFGLFWAVVFMVLFRMTAPKTQESRNSQKAHTAV